MTSNNVIYLDDYLPHYPLEAMCMACFHRWITVVPYETVLKSVECEQCGPGYVIDTGQYIENVIPKDTPESGDAV